MKLKLLRNTQRGRSAPRRRGVVLVYTVLGMFSFLGIAAFAVDVGSLYRHRSRAQAAADAAALSAAYELSRINNPSRVNDAHRRAFEYARRNYYDVLNGADLAPGQIGANGADVSTARGFRVRTIYPIPGRASQFRVIITGRHQMIFSGIFGPAFANPQITASSIASYSVIPGLNITGGGPYGSPDGPTTLSLFGPDGYFNNGDCYSVRLLPDGSPNPRYTGNGYDFMLSAANGMGPLEVEIFDPDSYNTGNQPDAVRGVSVDELRLPGGGRGTPANATTTRYRLYRDNGTPYNPLDDVLLEERSYGNDSSTDMIWNRVFTVNRDAFPRDHFRLNVTSTAGSSENGFLMRAGPLRNPGDPFNENNGTMITGSAYLPMNFNGSGQSRIEIGTVPIEAAGKTLRITKFDTDIQSQSVTYQCDTLPGRTWTGVLAGNGQFTTDTIDLPDNYQGGRWFATYTAGSQDTSVWELSFVGVGPETPGEIRLVE